MAEVREMSALGPYDQLAPLFVYPDAQYTGHVEVAIEALRGEHPEAAKALTQFRELLPPSDPAAPEIAVNAIQEIFTRSFEVQSITTLDVGYVIFGDDYKRAELLVNLNREQRMVGNELGTELSDHLPTVLRLLSRWENAELALEFVQQILHPALRYMIEEFNPERIERRNVLYKKHHKTLIVTAAERTTMYRFALKALKEVLRADFEFVWEPPQEQSSEFLRSIVRELTIAENGAGKRPSSMRLT